ncbi:P-loop containing nucleoside triphosphate hydrolase protein [Trichoderma reesei RUT C-30]|uniref:p-loop containing nucleoside triphosphate hydrolase protein n=1 Tax=Hypocrea jecorina (strain ATCC 56765 / BCRC 32924 / NRRL 11460 / Rut C-30) TaxID=1344414 RepID=A0A024SHU8_HYPJR|nr:P-loop containing nucleoside triphosphate hydrolase protein [Trichoderma reesei RUT C-30]
MSRNHFTYPTPPSTPSEGSLKPCFFFLRDNSCKFGARCKFSHNVSSSTLPARQPYGRHPGAPSSLPGNRHDRSSEGKLSTWKRMLKSGQDTARPSQAIVSQFLKLAVELMDGDVGGAQETIRLLVTEAGLSFIKDVIDRHIPMDNISITGNRLWETEIKPLFQLVTHPRVVDSAVLEQEVAAIFNYLVGVGGARMNKLFHYVVSLFQQWPPTSTQGSLIEAVELSLAVLAKMLDCNTTNIINEAFSTFADSLASPLDKSEEPDEMVHRLQAKKHLHYIRQRLQIGDELPDLATRPQASVTRETFMLTRDLPGRLSRGGPRHNNDHANIAHIKILPTYEEIMSPREEYLPTNDCSQWHIPGIRGRLDREFRLIREDTVGQLRDAVRDAFTQIRGATAGVSHHANSNNLRTYTYGSAALIDLQFDTNTGLDLIVRCAQPPAVRALSARQRRDWWEKSKRLQAGALVCVLDGTESVMFCIVSESTMRNKDDKKDRFEKKPADEDLETPEKREPLTLSDNESYLHVNLQLIDANPDDVAQALDWYTGIKSSHHRYLVEFPGILLASFKHTLDALKEMSQRPKMPFVDLLAPTNVTTTEVDLQPPLYARKAGFAFDIRCITNDQAELLVSPQRPLNPRLIESRTTLDRTQSSALLNTLSRELSLIQGPPGTGKSYSGEKIIKVLLANKRIASIGPILCVCYTNHALDQLLEHLLDDGIKKIIRIGSRSKSERLQALNLRMVSQNSDRTRSEKGSLWDIQQELNELRNSMKDSLQRLSASDSLQSIKTFLAHHFPRHHDALFGVEEDGWQTVGNRPDVALRRWLTGGSRDNTHCRDLGVLRQTRLSVMNHAERQALHRDWLESIVAPILRTITSLQSEYAELMERRGRVRSDVDLRCLNQADIIGVTTTGLAKNLDLLRKLRCKVMLCEEAGEVLEAHILTALLPSIEHAILIGDHLQLRPQIQNYELQSTNPRGRQYSLDTSLFERLVEPPHLTDLRLPFSTLETQRRMHPSISELIRSTLYPSLQDGENVMNYPKVAGMKDRLFWLHHEHLEAGAASHDPLNTSHSNDFEVEMTVSLISHLVKQGEYSQDDIAVITPYLGQLHKLRRRMQSMFEICLNDRDLAELEDFEDRDGEAPMTAKWKQSGKTTLLKSVRAATVDNFQGEEAKVIIISLVRSNLQKKCGFLSTSNRINVLLSRAKHGMYIIGNSSTYYNVPMWEQVIDMLTASGRLGTHLELQCSRHPNTPIRVSKPDHFLQFSPESGCNLPCDKRLHCGHSCTASRSRAATGCLRPSAGRIKIPLLFAARSPSDARCQAAVMRSRCNATKTCVGPSLCGEACPDKAFCQQCASESVRSICVDFLEMKEYHEINLDEEPCIFPDCGHFLTTSSMDGQMGMSAYYDMDEEGHPTRLSKTSEPFSLDKSGIPVCATCRGSLRNIARYGRIVRRAILDESTKKFLAWSHEQYLSLANRLIKEEEKLAQGTAGHAGQDNTGPSSLKKGQFIGSAQRLKQLRELQRMVGKERYDSIIELWRQIGRHANNVRLEEQPFQRVADLVQFANRENKASREEFRYDESVVQVKGSLLADALLLKCEIAILFDFHRWMTRGGLAQAETEVKLDLSAHWSDCVRLIEQSRLRKYVREEVQGHIFAAQLCGLCLSFDESASMWSANKGAKKEQTPDSLREEALSHIQQARTILSQYPSTASFQGEIDNVEMLINGGIYRRVTAEEMRAVYSAMTSEFSGTGHWYTCENNHPFTIGECGMPMQEARCPECGARIGGQNHRAVAGTRHATEIENLARGMNGLGL